MFSADNTDTQPTASRTLVILNKLGLHARPAALFVEMARTFKAEITVEKDELKISAESIIGLLTMEGYQGAEIKIKAIGCDAEEAVASLAELVEQKFFEE